MGRKGGRSHGTHHHHNGIHHSLHGRHSRHGLRSSHHSVAAHYPPPDVAFTLEVIGQDASCGFPCCSPSKAQVDTSMPTGLQGYMLPEEYDTMATELNTSMNGTHWPIFPSSFCCCFLLCALATNSKRINNCKAVLAKQDIILKERGLFW